MATRFITVGIEIMHDKNLTSNQKFIIAEIQQLSQLERGCYAHNQHFAELIGMARESVSRSIKDLEKKGYISVEIVNGSRNHERLLTLNNLLNPPKQFVKPPLTKSQETKENKTVNKTINRQKTPTLEEISIYINSKNLNVDANKFYNYFEAGEWKDSKGNKVKNWKQKLLTWDNHSTPKKEEKVRLWG